MKVHSALLLAACLATLAGCTPASETPEDAAAQFSDEQSEALGDNAVTLDEYKAGYRAYVECLNVEGYSVNELGEENMVLNYEIPEAAVTTGVDEVCYEKEFKQINLVWQLSRQDSSGQAEAFRQCVIKAGKTPAKSYLEVVQQLAEMGIDPRTCL